MYYTNPFIMLLKTKLSGLPFSLFQRPLDKGSKVWGLEQVWQAHILQESATGYCGDRGLLTLTVLMDLRV